MQPGYKPLSAKLRAMERSGQIAAMVRAAPKPMIIDVSNRRWAPPKLPQVSTPHPSLLPTPENMALSDECLVIGRIIRTVAEAYDMHPRDIKSLRRMKDISRARKIAVYLSKVLTSRSYPSIGAYFGGRDHTSIIHSVRAVQSMMREDEDFALEVSGLLMRLAPKKTGGGGDA